MEPNFYTETATVLNADADFRSLLKPSALLYCGLYGQYELLFG